MCDVKYEGESYPQWHGASCIIPGPHVGRRHQGYADGAPLSWWTEEEKVRLRGVKMMRRMQTALSGGPALTDEEWLKVREAMEALLP